ncbi:crotonase/enoyl-CoA hydratase family protein [Nocardioides kribbensis]|uniref:Crotonase/enoyl-CoA hydratase family protein n=1 Tax=Nocardioides kribbensis TaxID=305517 RepID=A0ABV1P392_9ACTN
MGAAVGVEDVGAVRVVTLDRPAVRNALDLPTATALAEALDGLDDDPGLAVGVLTGAGGHFCAGMDLKAFLATGQRPEVPGRGLGFTRRPPVKPLVAAVEGTALAGGFEIVLACDLVVAALDARLGLPEARLGLVAGAGGLLRLSARVPRAVAMRCALTGEPFSAQEAERWGLVNEVTPPGEALDRALALARQVAASAPGSLRASKELLDRRLAPSADDVARQDELLEALAASDDAREGARAFAEKRPPVWGRTP